MRAILALLCLFSGLPDGFYNRNIDFSPGEADDGDSSWAVTLSSGRPVAVGTFSGPFTTAFGIVRLESALVFADGFETGDVSRWQL